MVVEEPQTVSPDEVRANARDFYNDGFVVIKNAFSPEYIQELYDHFVETYAAYFEDKVFADASHVGDKRTMLTVDIKGPFNIPDFYANERIMAVITSLLGDEIVLGGVGAVTSLPGAEIQHLHRDHRGLFGEDNPATPYLPPYAITVIVPLVPITAANGATRMYAGSQRVPRAIAEAKPTVDPYTELGDCIFMDYRMLHRGLANNSGSLRPILYITYYREWFRDYQNYTKHNPLSISMDEYAKMPPEHRYLVSWLLRGRC
jgi:ectoine hydroxylase-related dioxygenase (phytanoyl-CoA dioxygenase family)